MKEGIIIVDKSAGMTSHDVVDFIRAKLQTRRVGHAGTLDPIATGVLLILVGRCTKLFSHFLDFDKEYSATLTLGKSTLSGDSEGEVLEVKDYSHVTREKAEEAMRNFTGQINQVPPMVSAVKHKGKRLYALARSGIKVDRVPRSVLIKELKLLEFDPPHIKFQVKCSKGTYVRQLAEDIAINLGCVGHITQIKRLSIGPFNIKEACVLGKIDESCLRPYSL